MHKSKAKPSAQGVEPPISLLDPEGESHPGATLLDGIFLTRAKVSDKSLKTGRQSLERQGEAAVGPAYVARVTFDFDSTLPLGSLYVVADVEGDLSICDGLLISGMGHGVKISPDRDQD